MTTQQQNIIDSLVAEFNKINTPIHNGFARIGEALDKCDEWATLYAGVQASNERFEYLREQMIETDFERLLEECRLAGVELKIEQHSDHIKIDNYSPYSRGTDNAVYIRYKFARYYHASGTGKSIYENKAIIYQSHQAIGDGEFTSIEGLFQDDKFFRAWTKLIEISRK
jgi:hypothetical protein